MLADENQEIFREKVKFLKFSSKSENFSEIGGKSETGGNASWSQGVDAPVCFISYGQGALVSGIRIPFRFPVAI